MNSKYYPKGAISMQETIKEYFNLFNDKNICEIEITSYLGLTYYGSACGIGITKEVNEELGLKCIGVWRIKFKKDVFC